jgi:hypothetical protein
MDHDHALQARHHGELTEAIIKTAEDANGWRLILVTREGEHLTHTAPGGADRIYHSLDAATDAAREIGFDDIRVEEDF